MSKNRSFLSVARLFLVISMVILMPGKLFAGFEDRTYEVQRLELVRSINEIMVKGGLCSSDNDCNKKQLMFASPGRSGVDIGLYGVSDVAIVRSITDVCVAMFFRHSGAMSITIEVYQMSKAEDLRRPFWRSRSPYMEIKFEGAK
jgi:hypothetical protein